MPAPMQVAERRRKKVFGLTGLSNSGKTTLAEDLIAWLRLKGYTVSAIKHAHQGFDIDKPGKDSFRLREAGAEEVFLIGDKRWVLMREYHDDAEPTLEDAVARLAPCDIVLVEGFKTSAAPKLEVFRPSLGRPPLWPNEPSIVAVASDEALDCPLPVLPLNSPDKIAQYIQRYLEL